MGYEGYTILFLTASNVVGAVLKTGKLFLGIFDTFEKSTRIDKN